MTNKRQCQLIRLNNKKISKYKRTVPLFLFLECQMHMYANPSGFFIIFMLHIRWNNIQMKLDTLNTQHINFNFAYIFLSTVVHNVALMFLAKIDLLLIKVNFCLAFASNNVDKITRCCFGSSNSNNNSSNSSRSNNKHFFYKFKAGDHVTFVYGNS